MNPAKPSSRWSDAVDEVVVAGLVLGALVAGSLPTLAVAAYIGTVLA